MKDKRKEGRVSRKEERKERRKKERTDRTEKRKYGRTKERKEGGKEACQGKEVHQGRRRRKEVYQGVKEGRKERRTDGRTEGKHTLAFCGGGRSLRRGRSGRRHFLPRLKE
jgi:hypothetical protein